VIYKQGLTSAVIRSATSSDNFEAARLWLIVDDQGGVWDRMR
jgi:hypothetical protein